MSTARLVTTTLLAGSMAMLPVGVSAAQATPSRPTPPDAVLQWDEIAANTVVKSGAFQNEGLLYMGYVSSAVYDAARPLRTTTGPTPPVRGRTRRRRWSRRLTTLSRTTSPPPA